MNSFLEVLILQCFIVPKACLHTHPCVCMCIWMCVSREMYFELVFLKINNFWLIKFVTWQSYIIHPDPYPTFFISGSLSIPTFPTGLFPTSMSLFCLWATEFNLDCLYDHEFGTVYWSLVVLLVGTQLKTMTPSPLASILRQASLSSEVLSLSLILACLQQCVCFLHAMLLLSYFCVRHLCFSHNNS